MSDDRYAKWSALTDAQTAGTPLSEAEQDFCAEVERESAWAAAEAKLVGQLANDGGAEALHDATARAIVDEALATVARDRHSGGAGSRASMGRRTTRRHPGLAITAGLGLAMAAALMGIAWLPVAWNRGPAPAPSFRAELVYTSGNVTVDGVRGVVGGEVLAPGSVIATGDGRACLVLDPGIDACTGPRTQLRIDPPTNSERALSLLAGEVTASLSHQPKGSHFAIKAGDLSARALGTVFAVAREPGSDAITTVVSEGVVAVTRAEREVLVRAHERARSDGPATLATVESVSRMEEAHLRASLVVAELWHGDLSSTLEVQAVDPAVVLLDGKPVGRTPLRVVVPSGSHTVSVGDGPPRTVALEAGEQAVVRFDAQPTASAPATLAPERDATGEAKQVRDERPSATRAATTRKRSDVSASERLRRAREFAVAHRFDHAAREYEALLRQHRGAPETHAALVTLGELRLAHLGQARKALQAFDRYLSQGGPLAHEALHGKTRALRRLGRNGDEARAIDQLLQRYPTSPHRAALEGRRAELANQGASNGN